MNRITSALKRRGLLPELDGDAWEVHGPHQGMNYQWYEGWAYYSNDKNEYLFVHIYPRAVYSIDPNEPYIKQYTIENRIYIDQ